MLAFNPAPGWPLPPDSGWLPPSEDWTPDPAWPSAPVGWPVLLADRPVERPRLLGWPRWIITARQQAARAADRPPSGWEVLLVLGLFPGTAVFAALTALVERTTHAPSTTGYTGQSLPGRPLLGALLDVGPQLLGVVPALLVAYLLARSGGGLAAIGLDRSQPRADLARAGKLLLLAYLVPFFLGAALISSAGLQPTSGSVPTSPAYLLALLPAALAAGVVEEVVVLGYLVHRLEQRGWNGWRLVAVCTAVRVSYHVYYGASVLGFVGWAAVSVVLYRQRRRLLPFIVLHAMWDTSAFTTRYLPDRLQFAPFTVLLATVLVLYVLGRRASGPGHSDLSALARAASSHA